MGYQAKGHRLMAFVDNMPIALATNHTLSISPSILTDRTKDDGDAPVGEFDNYSWNISADSVVGYNEEVSSEQTIVDLIDTMLRMDAVGIITDAATPTTGSVPDGGWVAVDDSDQYPSSVGDAYIESISVSAPATGFATASVSFKGQGELV